MDIKSELGIGQTTDKREIRRAYARRLKETHPEDDPEGFKRLRAAYEAALNYADYFDEDGDEGEAETVTGGQEEPAEPQSAPQLGAPRADPGEVHEEDSEERRQEAADRRAMQDMAAGLGRLLDEGDDAGAAAALEIAIADPVMLNLTNRRIFEYMVLEAIGERDPPPPATAKIAVQAFRWNEHWTDLPGEYQYLADRLLAVPLAEDRLAELRKAANTRFTNDHEKTAARLLFGRYRPIVFNLNNSIHVLEAMRQLLAELRAEHPEVLEKEIDPRVLAWWSRATGRSDEHVRKRSRRITWFVFGLVFAASLLRRLLSD